MTELDLEITIEETQDQLQSDADRVVLLDCRNPHEYELVHLERATLIPMDEIPSRVSELEKHKEKQIIVYCHMGVRSNMVAQWLRENGFGQAQSLAGGIDAWSVKVDPSLPRY